MTASRIDAAFTDLRAHALAAFMPFFVAGDPDLKTCAELIRGAAEAGADLIEVGIPFSDPIADGALIQAAFCRTLERGFKVTDAFALARGLRQAGLRTPLVCMLSYSLVFKRTPAAFFAACAEAGYDGVIIPDLPAGYDDDAAALAAAAGVDLIFLAAPTTMPERRALIAKRSRGFIYYVSVAGVTGDRAVLPPDLAANVGALKSLTTTPVCVGFGVGAPEQAARIAAFADGVIVGSALVKRVDAALARHLAGPDLVREVSAFVAELAAAAHTRR